MYKSLSGNVGAFSILSALLICPLAANADAFDEYASAGSFDIPGDAGSPSAVGRIDVLNDGRIIGVLPNGDVYLETGLATREFQVVGMIPFAPGVNLAFMRVSPDGASFITGEFSDIALCDIDPFSCIVIDASHFAAEWVDDRDVALTGGEVSVAILDTMSPDPSNPDITEIIVGAGNAGITIDSSSNLYVGRFPGGVRFFDNASWTAAFTSGIPLDYEMDGTLIVDVLSAVSLGFDVEGNLHVGGSGGFNGAALVRASAVSNAIAGGGPADASDPSEVRGFVANECAIEFYLPRYNPVTEELYVRCFSETTVDVYQVPPPVPALSGWGVCTMALLTCLCGVAIVRGRDKRSLTMGVR